MTDVSSRQMQKFFALVLVHTHNSFFGSDEGGNRKKVRYMACKFTCHSPGMSVEIEPTYGTSITGKVVSR